MERSYRASNGLYFYAAFLAFDALILGWEAASRLRNGALVSGVLLALLALACLALALTVFARWGRQRVVITSDSLVVHGDRPVRRLHWSEVNQVREVTGPAYQLSLKQLLPGPYLPHSLVRGETVLEVTARPAMRVVLRRALLEGYEALRQDVLRSVPRDAEVDLHARWWREDEE